MKDVVKGMDYVGGSGNKVGGIYMTVEQAKRVIYNSRASESIINLARMFNDETWQLLIDFAEVIYKDFENISFDYNMLIRPYSTDRVSKRTYFKSTLKDWILRKNYSTYEMQYLVLAFYIMKPLEIISSKHRIDTVIKVIGDIFMLYPEMVE